MKWRLVALALLIAAPFSAEAGRRPFIWAYDAEIVPEGDVELEQWLWERAANVQTPPSNNVYWVWWAPVIGLTDHFELAIPFQLLAPEGQPVQLESFELDLRYRLFSRQSTDPFQPLVRLAWHEAINGGQDRLDANLVGSMPTLGPVHLVLDLGVRFGLANATRGSSVLGTYDLGGAYALTDELKVAVEAFGEVPITGVTTTQHHFIGPSLSWTRGRFWLTAGVLIGLTPINPETPKFMPRVIWAVAL